MSEMTSAPTVFDVRAYLMGLIRGGKLGSGGRLPTEREICTATGAGRRLVRRALASLEAEGLVWRRQGKGTFAGQPVEPIGVLAAEINGTSQPIEVMEARLCIEPELAALCARRVRPDEIRRMRVVAQRRLETGDNELIELWDSALHRLIAKSARNRPLLTSFAMLDETRATAAWQGMRARARSDASLRESQRQHMRIIEAIEAGDAEEARAAMRDHLMSRSRAMSDELSGRIDASATDEPSSTKTESMSEAASG